MPVLGAGTKFLMGNDGDPEDFVAIPKVKEIGDAGSESTPVDTTCLDDESKQYMAGMSEGPDHEIKGLYEKLDTQQKAFRDAAKNRETKNFKIQYKDGSSCIIRLLLLGYKSDKPENENPNTFTVKAKQIGDPTWDEA